MLLFVVECLSQQVTFFMNKSTVTIQADVRASVARAWEVYTKPEYITQWNFASDEWHCPSAENDLRVGGTFSSRMEAKDGSFGFDFGGEYTAVQEYKHIAYTMGDGRTVDVQFSEKGDHTHVEVVFDIEDQNSAEMQRSGWQAILDNFKKCAEHI